MPTLCVFHGIVIQMFWRDHNPPHFHAVHGDTEALIDLRTLAIIEGALGRRQLELVRRWAEAHRAELLENWELCQRKQRPNRIEPLA